MLRMISIISVLLFSGFAYGEIQVEFVPEQSLNEVEELQMSEEFVDEANQDLIARSINFGTVRVRDSRYRRLRLRNTGNDKVMGLRLRLRGDTSFRGRSNCGASLEPNQSCTVSLEFRPYRMGSHRGRLSVNGSNIQPLNYNLFGWGRRDN